VPAARDAFLQALLLLGGGDGLPVAIERIRFHAPYPDGGSVVCRVRARKHKLLDIDVFTPDGLPLESIGGVRIAPRAVHVQLADLERVLSAHAPLALAVAERPRAPRGGHRNQGIIRTAARAYLGGGAVRIAYASDGRPRLEGRAGATPVAVSAADSGRLAVGVAGPGRLGIDIETVAHRDDAEWQALLGDDRHALAVRLAQHAAEPLDAAATRVWTLFEAGRKAWDHDGALGDLKVTTADAALVLENGSRRYVSVLVRGPDAAPVAVALAAGDG
jgi:enediyne polyketide synthase